MQETTARMDSKKNSYWRKKRKPMHCAPKSPWMLMCQFSQKYREWLRPLFTMGTSYVSIYLVTRATVMTDNAESTCILSSCPLTLPKQFMPTDASIFIATAQWCQFVLNMLRSIDQFLHKKRKQFLISPVMPHRSFSLDA